MKQIIFMWITCLFFIHSTFAQEASNDKVTDITKQMQSQIGFSDVTYAKVYGVNLDFLTKTQQLKESKASKFKKLKALKDVDKDRDEALKEIFTDEEYEKFEDYKSDNRAAMKERLKEARD